MTSLGITETTSYIVTSQSGSGSSATYTVSINESMLVGKASMSFLGVATVLGDGTVSSLIYNAGFGNSTLTGSQAGLDMESLMGPFTMELNVQSTYPMYLSLYNIVKVSQATISIGPASVSVTNYQAQNTPFTESACGYSITINSLNIQLGQVKGSSYGSLVTYESLNAVISGSAVGILVQVTSITAS